MSKTNFTRNSEWFTAAKKEPGNPNQFSTQLGCHIEEFIEMIRTLSFDQESADITDLGGTLAHLDALAGRLKAGKGNARISNPVGLLDALCDQDVTANGLAFFAGFKKDEADQRVIDSNFDKFNEDGTSVFKEGGKIGKREGWTAPKLVEYAKDVHQTLLDEFGKAVLAADHREYYQSER